MRGKGNATRADVTSLAADIMERTAASENQELPYLPRSRQQGDNLCPVHVPLVPRGHAGKQLAVVSSKCQLHLRDTSMVPL